MNNDMYSALDILIDRIGNRNAEVDDAEKRLIAAEVAECYNVSVEYLLNAYNEL